MRYTDATLKSMTKDNLIAMIRCLEHNLSVAEERNSNQFKILMEHEKYRWHDLRKKPEDLPKIGYSCICFFDNGDCSVVVRYDDCWAYNELRGLREMPEADVDEIAAWREIEPFDEEEE